MSRGDTSSCEERDKTYFGYYGQLMHQQNMLLDNIRTAAYYEAITGNKGDFEDRVVLDIGAGTGILSFFAVKAGARRVYAVEASEVAAQAQRLVAANQLADRIIVLRGRIEEVELPEPVDVIISEPMGVMLVHERMMESFLVGRDRFLKRNVSDACVETRQMFPSSSSIYLSPFSDLNLYADAVQKIGFWNNRDFYGVDLSCLVEPAAASQFAQVVVGPVDPKTLLAPPQVYHFDFTVVRAQELRNFTINFSFTSELTGIVHGIAGWFDVQLAGSSMTKTLSTGPNGEITHWYQARFVFPHPIAINRGQQLDGSMHFAANDQRSHDVTIKVHLEGQEIRAEHRYAMQDQQYWNLTSNTNNALSREFLALYE